jgi:hypothetical protein
MVAAQLGLNQHALYADFVAPRAAHIFVPIEITAFGVTAVLPSVCC